MKAFELMGEVDEQHRLQAQMPDDCAPGAVRVLVLTPENGTSALPKTDPQDDDSWNDLLQLIESHTVDTGISDLAHQHDHYIHGTPKRSDP